MERRKIQRGGMKFSWIEGWKLGQERWERNQG
jgi:predicted N-acyltransferase